MTRTPLVQRRPSNVYRLERLPGAAPRPNTGRLTALAVIICWSRAFQFRTDMGVWMLLPLAVPCLLAASSRRHRAQVVEMVRRRALEVLLYARDPGRQALPWAAAILFVGLPSLALYLSNLVSGAQADSQPVMPAAVSLVREGNTDLDEFLGTPSWTRMMDEQGLIPYFTLNREGNREIGRGPVHSAYPAGMVPFAVPVALAGRLAGASMSRLPVVYQMEKLSAALVGATAATLFFLAALHLGSLGGAMAATVCFTAASGIFSVASQLLWQQGGIILWMLVVLLAEFRHQVRPNRATIWIQGLACGCLPACRPSAAIFLVPFGIWLAVRDFQRASRVVAIALLAYLPWAGYYLAIYGRLFGPTSNMLDPRNWSSQLLEPLAGVLVSPGRGLLVYQPWLILLPLALLYRPDGSREPRSWRTMAAVVIGLQVLMVAAWGMWWGGHCWGSRLVLEVVPLGGLLCVAPMGRLLGWRGGRALLGTLFVAGFLTHAPMIYLKAHRWNGPADVDNRPESLWSWRKAPFFWPLTREAPTP